MQTEGRANVTICEKVDIKVPLESLPTHTFESPRPIKPTRFPRDFQATRTAQATYILIAWYVSSQFRLYGHNLLEHL